MSVNDCEEALAAIALEVRTIFNEKVWIREDSKNGNKVYGTRDHRISKAYGGSE